MNHWIFGNSFVFFFVVVLFSFSFLFPNFYWLSSLNAMILLCLKNMVGAYKKGSLAWSKCFKFPMFQSVKSIKAADCSLIVFFLNLLGNRFLKIISERFAVLILSLFGRGGGIRLREGGPGWRATPQAFYISYFASLSKIHTNTNILSK